MSSKTDIRTLWKLFISTLYLSAFTFGGGYVIVTLMKKTYVDDYQWISEKEMLNFTAIAQSSPGAIAVNAAIVVGYKISGFIGVLVAVLGTVIPPFIIISLISFFYEAFRANIWISLMLEGMQAGVAAVVTAVSFEMAAGVIKDRSMILTTMMIVAFIANAIFKVNVIVIILLSVIIGIVYHLVHVKRGDTV